MYLYQRIFFSFLLFQAPVCFSLSKESVYQAKQAYAYFESGQYSQAATIYEKILEDKRLSSYEKSICSLNVSLIFMAKGDWNAARQKIQQVDPEDFKDNWNLLRDWHLKQAQLAYYSLFNDEDFVKGSQKIHDTIQEIEKGLEQLEQARQVERKIQQQRKKDAEYPPQDYEKLHRELMILRAQALIKKEIFYLTSLPTKDSFSHLKGILGDSLLSWENLLIESLDEDFVFRYLPKYLQKRKGYEEVWKKLYTKIDKEIASLQNQKDDPEQAGDLKRQMSTLEKVKHALTKSFDALVLYFDLLQDQKPYEARTWKSLSLSHLKGAQAFYLGENPLEVFLQYRVKNLARSKHFLKKKPLALSLKEEEKASKAFLGKCLEKPDSNAFFVRDSQLPEELFQKMRLLFLEQIRKQVVQDDIQALFRQGQEDLVFYQVLTSEERQTLLEAHQVLSKPCSQEGFSKLFYRLSCLNRRLKLRLQIQEDSKVTQKVIALTHALEDVLELKNSSRDKSSQDRLLALVDGMLLTWSPLYYIRAYLDDFPLNNLNSDKILEKGELDQMMTYLLSVHRYLPKAKQEFYLDNYEKFEKTLTFTEQTLSFLNSPGSLQKKPFLQEIEHRLQRLLSYLEQVSPEPQDILKQGLSEQKHAQVMIKDISTFFANSVSEKLKKILMKLQLNVLHQVEHFEQSVLAVEKKKKGVSSSGTLSPGFLRQDGFWGEVFQLFDEGYLAAKKAKEEISKQGSSEISRKQQSLAYFKWQEALSKLLQKKKDTEMSSEKPKNPEGLEPTSEEMSQGNQGSPQKEEHKEGLSQVPSDLIERLQEMGHEDQKLLRRSNVIKKGLKPW